MMATDGIELQFGRVESPIGAVLVACRGNTLCALDFEDHEDRMLTELRSRFHNFRRVEVPDPGGVCTRLRSYFKGDIEALDDIEVDGGGTSFQRKVWKGLRRIKAGQISSYGALAKRLGIPAAVRAVGHANAVNPISIVVPCHRVICSDGSLTGYGGGIDRKAWLLEHEGVEIGERRGRVTSVEAGGI
jgi:methylated-DNA-[protein]-cysteine S-methyltransferase